MPAHDHHENLRRFNEAAIETFMPDEDAQPCVRVTILKRRLPGGPFSLTPDFIEVRKRDGSLITHTCEKDN